MRSGPIIRGGIRDVSGGNACDLHLALTSRIVQILRCFYLYGVRRWLNTILTASWSIVLFWLYRYGWLAVVRSYGGASSIAGVVHMEHQHTTHIVTCGDSTQSQISNKSKLSNSMAMDTLYSEYTWQLSNNVHSYAIWTKMPYNILCYSRRRVRSKDGDSWFDTGNYFLFSSVLWTVGRWTRCLLRRTRALREGYDCATFV